jgi:uridine phosphorylase
MHDYPILEFDPQREAVIDPQRIITPVAGMPLHCVLCFFGDQVARLAAEGAAVPISEVRSEMGPQSVYRLAHGAGEVAIVQPGVGAPLAAGFLEELIGQGCRRFIACGGAGVLDRDIAAGHLLVPTAAVRDEGTSYHYLAPSREVVPDARALAAIERVLNEHHVEYLRCKTWTTDAFYRETPDKVARRRQEGCLCVEMEASALFAVARFRDVPLAQILYAGDDVSGIDWDARQWNHRHDVRERVIWLAAEACLRL